MRHNITVIILAVMLVLSMLPTSALATDNIILGYDDYDIAKIQAFLDLPNGTETNAQKLRYDRDRPITWSYVRWDESVSPKRVREITWNNEDLVGDLDLSGCTSLEKLSISYAYLTSVNVSGCTSLNNFACTNSGLQSLNVSGCTALNTLGCNVNQLTALDISTCTALKNLNLYDNDLTEIDVSHNPLLEGLQCAFNPMESLDVSGHVWLDDLTCNDCELKTLNVSGCTALDRFFCHNNQLKSVDISTCTALKTFYCKQNDMETLNLGVITGLTWLDCTENPMTSFYGEFGGHTFRLTADGNGFVGMFYQDNTMGTITTYALAEGNGTTSFINWTDEMGTSVGTDTKKTLKYYKDNNVTAHFSDCVVTFDKNGGDTDADPKSIVVPVGTTVSVPTTNPTRSDYIFDGWFKEPTCNYSWNFDTDTVSGNTTLYAEWVPVLHVTDVTLNLTAKTLDKNGTVTLTADVTPSDATYPDITWTSSDESVATVDANGKVTAVSPGTATIKATADGMQSTCTVTVNPVNVTSVTLSIIAKTLDKNGTVTLTADVLPSDATYPDIAWTSSDESVATVDENGKVTALSAGTATITATADGKHCTCLVTVNPVHVTSVALNITAKTLGINGTVTLTADVLPSDATYPDIAWTSSDESVATVDANGKVTAVSPGTATIKATADGMQSTCTVTVNPVNVTSVTLSIAAKTLDKNGTVTLTADVLPSDATYPDIAWTSSDESVATVDENGKVTALSAGTATITATADGKHCTCLVTVNPVHVTSVALNITAKTLGINGTVTLTAEVSPSDSTYPDITWLSSNESVATVDENGKVTAIGAGTTTVTATADGKQSTCMISVTGQVQQLITVTGTLLDDDGEPLAGYTVELHSTPRTTVTDAKGRYTFADVEIADHSLTLKDKEGATLKSFAITVKTGNDFNWSKPDDDSITAVVKDDTASIDVTIKIADDGTVTINNIKNIINPKTGSGNDIVVYILAAAGLTLILAAILVCRKESTSKA